MSTHQEYELIKKIREQATENYDPIRQEIVAEKKDLIVFPSNDR
jgi:hypothetical protein